MSIFTDLRDQHRSRVVKEAAGQGQKYAVISSDHSDSQGAQALTPPTLHGTHLTHAAARELAAKVHKAKFARYNKLGDDKYQSESEPDHHQIWSDHGHAEIVHHTTHVVAHN